MTNTSVRILVTCILSICYAAAQCGIVDLRCEHLENPLGIDNATPRLSWRIDASKSGFSAVSYRVVVGTDCDSVAKGVGDMWDSDTVSSKAVMAVYAGRALSPQTKYYWSVKVHDEEGNSLDSGVASFETGKFGTRWYGNWISDGRGKDVREAPYFRKQFDVSKPIVSARAYVAVAGLYELRINGKRMGNEMLNPMYTRYDRRTLYVTYDITDALQQGKNAVGVILGNGWYNHQALAVWNFENAPWRNRPAMCMDIVVKYADGTESVVATDLSWKASTRGPLVYNNIYTGEHYDFRKYDAIWATVDYDDSNWRGVSLRAVPSGNVTAQQIRPIRGTQDYEPLNVVKISDSIYVAKFAQNMAGVTTVKIKGEAGTVLKVKHGERLGKDGRLDQSNIDVYYLGDKQAEPFQTDVLTLSGGEDEFTAQFGYKGFRYVEVEADRPIQFSEKNIMAHFVHSDVPKVGKIKSSNKIINKLVNAINGAYLSNLMGYPTDCPQREKNGWTGDGHLAIETGLYNFDGITVYEKWLADHRDEQQPNGVLPDIIPTGGWGYGTANGLDWTSTIAIIPWTLYVFYGDIKPLSDCYEAIKRYVDYVDTTYPSHLTTWGRGDWVPVNSRSNLELTSSVYFYVDARILAQAAELLGKEEDSRYYAALAENIKDAINEKYLNRETGIYAEGSQTELSVPLMWGVVPDDMKALVAKNLNDKVLISNWHLDVGVLGAKAILNALSENGYGETAYRLAVQDTYPSWGWWVRNGATTLLENWDLDAKRDISDNHMMFGEIGAWLYKGLGGIYPDSSAPGFEHVILRPNVVKDLVQYEARYESVRGEIVSGWEIHRGKVRYTVTIPAGSTATLYVPATVKGERETTIELTPGRHAFEWTMK